MDKKEFLDEMLERFKFRSKDFGSIKEDWEIEFYAQALGLTKDEFDDLRISALVDTIDNSSRTQKSFECNTYAKGLRPNMFERIDTGKVNARGFPLYIYKFLGKDKYKNSLGHFKVGDKANEVPTSSINFKIWCDRRGYNREDFRREFVSKNKTLLKYNYYFTKECFKNEK